MVNKKKSRNFLFVVLAMIIFGVSIALISYYNRLISEKERVVNVYESLNGEYLDNNKKYQELENQLNAFKNTSLEYDEDLEALSLMLEPYDIASPYETAKKMIDSNDHLVVLNNGDRRKIEFYDIRTNRAYTLVTDIEMTNSLEDSFRNNAESLRNFGEIVYSKDGIVHFITKRENMMSDDSLYQLNHVYLSSSQKTKIHLLISNYCVKNQQLHFTYYNDDIINRDLDGDYTLGYGIYNLETDKYEIIDNGGETYFCILDEKNEYYKKVQMVIEPEGKIEYID